MRSVPPLLPQRRAFIRCAPAVFLSFAVLALTFSAGVLYGSSASLVTPPTMTAGIIHAQLASGSKFWSRVTVHRIDMYLLM